MGDALGFYYPWRRTRPALGDKDRVSHCLDCVRPVQIMDIDDSYEIALT